jgi:hypothetical protein
MSLTHSLTHSLLSGGLLLSPGNSPILPPTACFPVRSYPVALPLRKQPLFPSALLFTFGPTDCAGEMGRAARHQARDPAQFPALLNPSLAAYLLSPF